MINVYNHTTNMYYGTLNQDGEIVSDFSDTDFRLNKLVIEETNHDKEYNIGMNELKLIDKMGEPLIKGCLYLDDNGGTALIFLRFEQETRIEDVLSYLNDDNCELANTTLYFTDGYEINFDNNECANVWQNEFVQIYDDLFTDLVEHEGIIIDGEVKHFLEYSEVIQ